QLHPFCALDRGWPQPQRAGSGRAGDLDWGTPRSVHVLRLSQPRSIHPPPQSKISACPSSAALTSTSFRLPRRRTPLSFSAVYELRFTHHAPCRSTTNSSLPKRRTLGVS